MNSRLTSHQSGNRKHHSTETLNILVSDTILEAMHKSRLSALILLDLSKAFDSISHSIVLHKLSCVGTSRVGEMVHQLFDWKITACPYWINSVFASFHHSRRTTRCNTITIVILHPLERPSTGPTNMSPRVVRGRLKSLPVLSY